MLDVPACRLKPPFVEQRPPFERIALLLQGGGALGSYQGGVYQALAEANLHPDWVAGISIGAVNAALIAGNPPEKRVGKLREFWESVSASPLGPSRFQYGQITNASPHYAVNQMRSLTLAPPFPGGLSRDPGAPLSSVRGPLIPPRSLLTAHGISRRSGSYGARWRASARG